MIVGSENNEESKKEVEWSPGFGLVLEVMDAERVVKAEEMNDKKRIPPSVGIWAQILRCDREIRIFLNSVLWYPKNSLA